MRETDAELRRLIEASESVRGAPISRLGYFCAPFRPVDGPFSDSVVKVYRSRADDAALDRLAEAHSAYVIALRECGIRLPDTELHLVQSQGRRVPVIVQAALPADSLMRPHMERADLETALALMESAGEVIATFATGVVGRPERIGFHPSIRNLAVLDGQGIFFDTFPPLIGYSRDEMGQLLITYSGSPLMRAVGPLLRARVTGIQDEWYSPADMLVGLVGSACRLRPAEADAFLAWGRDFSARRMQPHVDEIHRHLDTPPQLPGYWTAARRLLGLQGKPNI
ncbi:DUF6206 family protein [Tropicimonas isoalkanivorans]|uniref:DUF6206 family protein n=1 Tax=Tropicimonas isoalkanivorans TaxID=441112 RepID=UPI001FE12550|nr:DUF6206 family protein [Tropicimonas isoalkanivorans]